MTVQVIPVVIIGAGQAGLSIAHALAQRDVRATIVDGRNAVGGAWRDYYDSLTLFSPAQFSELDGLSLPGDPDGYPDAPAIAEYLQRYADKFSLDVRLGHQVTAV